MTKVVNLRHEPYDVYIGRPSLYGNPFAITRHRSRDDVIAAYREHLEINPKIVEQARKDLTGKTLGCYCKPLSCHGDVLIEFMEKAE